MVPSSILTITVDGEHLTCGGFSLGKTIRLGSFDFIAGYLGGLSFSLRRKHLWCRLHGLNPHLVTIPWQAMIEDSIEEFQSVSSGEGGSDLPSPGGATRGLYLLRPQPHTRRRML
jgi:hypothetical protein